MTAETAGIGLFGKHPGFGDFIGTGVPAALQAALEAWLTPALAQVSASRAEGFAGLYDHMAVTGFWIGGAVLAESARHPLRGALIASRDRVGRRYPLVLVQYPAAPTPPPLAQDDGFHAAAAAALAGLLTQEAVSPGDLLAGLPALPQAQGIAAEPEGHLFWAANPDHSAASVWHGLAATDLQRAAQGRSYWWTDLRPGLSASAALACAGMPDARALDWLMTGVAQPAAEAPAQSDAVEDTEDPPKEVPDAD